MRSVRAFCDHLYSRIDCGDLSSPLRLVHDFVEDIITDESCALQAFGSSQLDGVCQRVGELSLERILEQQNVAIEPVLKNVFVYIVTKLQNSGGHTRMLQEFIRAQAAGHHFILSTELAGRTEQDVLALFQEHSNVFLERAPRGTCLKKLFWLQQRLLSLRAAKIYLFSHHADSVAVAAVQSKMGAQTFFYHHADHHMSLGVHVSNLTHIDIHPFGYHHCREKLGLENVFVPLVTTDRGCRVSNETFLRKGYLVTCSVGRSNKVERQYPISYIDLIPDLLMHTRGEHLHIGKLSRFALWRIRRELKKRNIDVERFVYLPWVSSVWNALREFHVDLYIPTIPYGGGLTLVEVMGSGTPIALHQHVFSQLLSCVDLAPSDVFQWKWPEELYSYCRQLTQEKLALESVRCRARYEEFHTPSSLVDALQKFSNMGEEEISVPHHYQIDFDEWAGWMRNNSSFKALIHASLYKAFRKLRFLVS